MAKKKEGYRIGEMAEYFGVSTDTLRIYDRKELIPTARDQNNRYRIYNREDLIFLDYIMHLRKLDMPLKDVRRLVNGGSLEEALENMRQQRSRLEEMLFNCQNKLTLVQDYIESFSSTLEGMGKFSVGMSHPFLSRPIDQDMTVAMGDFARLTQTHVPKLTFVIPKSLVDLSPETHTPEHFNAIKAQFLYTLTMVDDEDFRSKDAYSPDIFTYQAPRKCLFTSIRTVTNHDYSEYFRCLDYIREHHLELDGDITLRSVSFRYCDVAYYDFWAPIK